MKKNKGGIGNVIHKKPHKKAKNRNSADRSIRKWFNFGIFKTHTYCSFRVAPTTDNNNEGIDRLIKAFLSITNTQILKNFRGGQPVVALEILATHERIYYMMTVPTQYKSMMKEKIQSAFPGGGIKEHEETDWPFTPLDKDTLIAVIQTKKDSFFPILMGKDESIAEELMHTLEELQKEEKAFIQILLEPAENGWQDELEKAYESYLNGNHSGASRGFLQGGGKKLDEFLTGMVASFSEGDGNGHGYRKHREVKDLRTKIRQSGFHVAVRLLSKAKSYERRNDIIEGVAGAFKTVSGENLWELAPVFRKESVYESVQLRKMPILGSVSLLCEDEVKSLWRLPTKEVQTRKLERMTPDEEYVDERLTKNIIPIGRSVEFDSEGKEVGFSITNADTSSKSKLVIAPPGSGKTTMVKRFMQGALDVGHGGSIFDVADGQLYYGSIECTQPKYRDKLVLVNFANERYPHVFNFNSLGSDADTIGAMFAEFFEIFYKTASNYRMNSILRKASMTNFTNPDNSFLELIMLMKDEDFRKSFLPTIRKENPDLFLWWKQEFPKIAKSDSAMQEILQPILYRLDELQYNKRLGPLFCGKGGKLEIFKWMNEGKWVLYNLSGGVFLENEQRMMMAFLNYAYWIATLQRERMLQNGIEPVIHHKIYDEPQTYMTATPVTKLSISKSRKYRVSDNFFIQNPSQLIEQDKALWQQIIGMNPHILIGGGLDDDNLKIISRNLNIAEQDLKQIEQLEYHWYMKTYVGKEAIKPFIVNAAGMPKTYGDDPNLVVKWRQYLAPRTTEEVRKDISARGLRLSIQEYDKLLASYENDAGEEGVLLGKDS